MAHRIYSEKFLSNREPAWHGLGLVTEEPLTGEQAADIIGLPKIYTETLKTSSGIELPEWKAILGKDGEKDAVCYSVVGKDYNEVTHFDFVRSWDKATNGAQIETMGLLGKGETLFLTTKLPSFKLKNEELDNYMLAYNPLTGKEAMTGRVTPVRVVCQNTLNMSAYNSVKQLRALHTQGAIQAIEAWLKNVWETAKQQTETLEETYLYLMDYQLKEAQRETVLAEIYPPIHRPDVDEKTDKGLDTLAAWERSDKRQTEHRALVTELYEGRGVGSDLPTTKGTSWGLLNAVVEYEDYGKSRRMASSTMFGAGGNRKQLTMDQLLALA